MLNKRIYLCSPLLGGNDDGLFILEGEYSELRKIQLKRTRNELYARACLKELTLKGYLVSAPHLLYAQVLDDFNPQERALGLALGLRELEGCEALVICGRFGISEGMEGEIAMANRLGIPVLHLEDVADVNNQRLKKEIA